ncbi:MAG: hypothetical protein HY731_05560 [Candidatus Tectomicrobia bacterium]|nr:hypothetical protein [Candidatus Tectomicrobia bacterium]
MPAYDESLFDPPAPLARVTLRDLQKGALVSDVPMLLDSGAGVTLIPEGSVNRVGVDISSHENYELRGFNGHTSLAHAVQLDLIFLRRTFRGRFLVINQVGRSAFGVERAKIIWELNYHLPQCHSELAQKAVPAAEL